MTIELRVEVLSSVGAQDMETSGYQVSDLDDVEIYWENHQLELNPVSTPRIHTPFSPSTFNDFEKG